MSGLRIALPLARVPLAILLAIWLLPGLVGHDPWKTDDAIGIGIAHQFAQHGDWLVPRLAGEHYAEDGPLFYWLAAAFVRLLGWIFAPHDAARLAAGACIALTLVFLRLAARELYAAGSRDNAGNANHAFSGESVMLLFAGCVGLLMHAHETISDSALLAGLACAYYGAALVEKKPVRAGIALGCGLGAAFLATGFAAIAPLCVALLVTPLFVSDWRSRTAATALLTGSAVLLPWLVLWPAALHAHAPELFAAWMSKAGPGALARAPGLAAATFTLKTLAWFAWPAWPIALWALWLYRRKPASVAVVLPLAALVAGLCAAAIARAPGELPLLPLLLPLALLAAQALGDLRRGAANFLAWFGIMTFSLLGAMMWLGYAALQTGLPPRIAANAARLEPGFVAQFAWAPALAALAITLLWLALVLRAERSPHRSITFWTAGLAMFWALAMLLWLPWIDYGKTYRPVALAIKAKLRGTTGCIASRGLGEAQRAAFDYHAGIRTERSEARARRDCRLLLVQDNARLPEASPGESWKRIWEGNRPGDRAEKFRLYVRETP